MKSIANWSPIDSNPKTLATPKRESRFFQPTPKPQEIKLHILECKKSSIFATFPTALRYVLAVA
ncbi:MAG: hypothetical protein EA001_16295 [Oscillatoriales cyanobacterium]|nr:MAG: hypothetical protein EA001_16295 [Oscillatoriales cyanobacterium]